MERTLRYLTQTKEIFVQKLCNKCGTLAETDGSFCATCGNSYATSTSTTSTTIPTGDFSGQIKGNANPTFVWSSIGIGAVGLISTFLPYAKDDYDSINGWDSADVLSSYDQYSSGTIMILLFSIVNLIVGLMHFSSAGQRQNAKSQGISTIVVGVIALGVAHATYMGWDAAAIEEGVFVEIGIGLYLAYLLGLAMIVVGILCLTVPNFHRKSSS